MSGDDGSRSRHDDNRDEDKASRGGSNPDAGRSPANTDNDQPKADDNKGDDNQPEGGNPENGASNDANMASGANEPAQASEPAQE